jgi:hypothetical protein
VEILWRDPAEKRNPRWIRVRETTSRWATPNGLRIGDDLLTIEKRNGWPFRLAGFTSEGEGGLLRDWKTGRLGNIPNCDIRVTFQPREGLVVPSSIRQVTSLPSVSSGHPVIQQINPLVVALWITHPLPPQSAQNPADSILDVLVFGLHMPMNAARYDGPLRGELEQFLRRAGGYVSKRMPESPSGETKMVYSAQLSYESRLAAHSDDPRASGLAQSYVTKLGPCYEWEGFHDCPEREAEFADKYQADNPGGPFSAYLPLLSAHRWLCAAEAYGYENSPVDAARSRSLYEQRLAVARQSTVLLIRAAAERLAERGQCLAPRLGTRPR